MLLLASHGEHRSVRGTNYGTRRSVPRAVSRPDRAIGTVEAAGSLKTEEKTERQCGQQREGFGSIGCCLSIQKSATSQRGRKHSQIWVLSPCVFPHEAPSSQPIGSAALERLDRFLLESLILAQDERWRRA